MSRALSVHQGKGASAEDAQLGALLEAVESHAAERIRRQTARFARSTSSRPASARSTSPILPRTASARLRRASRSSGSRARSAARLHRPACCRCRSSRWILPATAPRCSTAPATASRPARTRDEALVRRAARADRARCRRSSGWRGDMLERMACTRRRRRRSPCDWYRPWPSASKPPERASAAIASRRSPARRCSPARSTIRTRTALPYRAANGRGGASVARDRLVQGGRRGAARRGRRSSPARATTSTRRATARRETAILTAFGLPLPPGMASGRFRRASAEGPHTLRSPVRRAGAGRLFAGRRRSTLAEPPRLVRRPRLRLRPRLDVAAAAGAD